jgi:acyl-CoA dehydrogenase
MDFRLTQEQRLFRQTLREFCEREIVSLARQIDTEKSVLPDQLLEKMAGIGIFGISIPEKYGGSAPAGEEMVYGTIAVHELARADMSMSLPVYALLCMGWGSLLVKYGTEQLKKEILPKVATGKYFLGIATTEPSGGSDVANIRTRGMINGDRLVINGEKIFISGVREAFELREGGHITLVRTDPQLGHKGFTMVFVPARLPGATYTVLEEIGRRGLSNGTMHYHDVQVPEHHILGRMNEGFYLNMEGFNLARILVSSACVGMTERALEISREYVKQRVLFGRPLAKFEGVSFELAEDHARLEQLRMYLRYTAWCADTYYKEKGFISQRELSRMVSICKMTAPKIGAEIVQRCMTHLGASSYMKECPLGSALQGVMSYLVGAEGGYHIQKLIIAREYIGEESVPYR